MASPTTPNAPQYSKDWAKCDVCGTTRPLHLLLDGKCGGDEVAWCHKEVIAGMMRALKKEAQKQVNSGALVP